VFVGRDAEFQRLGTCLRAATEGTGGLVLVAGEAGIGKTALLEAFVARALRDREDLVVAVGNCNAQTGIADPLLPFRELMAALLDPAGDQSRDAGSEPTQMRRMLQRSAQILIDIAPDLIGTVLPGAGLVARLGTTVADRAGWTSQVLHLEERTRTQAARGPVEQGRIFEQYLAMLKEMSAEHPLLLVVDDLHWADDASVALLFHLTRRISQSRILIVGGYRPDEVAAAGGAGRSSLAKVLAETRRYAGDITIDLDRTDLADRRGFTDRLIDAEPNDLSVGFRDRLFAHTGGHPLFTVELLRTLQERGDLAREADGRWTAGSVDWTTLPPRVEGVIEERVGRLSPAEREVLDVASVEGLTFTAEVVASVTTAPLRSVARMLSDRLERTHRLVQERDPGGVERARRASFQFTHALVQHYLHAELGAAERRLLHADVARALEDLHDADDEGLSTQLAWHWDQAGERAQALPCYLAAGEQALRRAAPTEGIALLNRALDLLPSGDQAIEWRIRSARERALGLLSDVTERRDNIDALLRLTEDLADPSRQAQAVAARATFLTELGEQRAVIAAADDAIRHAIQAGDYSIGARCLGLKARALLRLGDVDAARLTIGEALSALDRTDDLDTHHVVLASAWSVTFESGDVGQSVDFAQRGLQVARRLGDRYLEAQTLGNLGFNYAALGRVTVARGLLEDSLRIAAALSHERYIGYSSQNLALVHLHQGGDLRAAEQLARDSIAAFADGDAFGAAGAQLYLGMVLDRGARPTEAASCFARAREAFAEMGSQALAMEATAGLARCALAEGDLTTATSLATDVWAHLQRHGRTGLDSIGLVFLTCVDAFAAIGDATQADMVLHTARRDLAERASRISDSAGRRAFLHDLPDHHAIVTRRHATPDHGAGAGS
jgi:adenylate cyclase